jgi:aspartyl-tRNA(Asn)/glutamyl-tRNA(Gln) amidotransferase subunit A
MADPADLPATEQTRLIASRALSPVELADAVLARIEAVEPVVHAFCAIDPDAVRTAARAAEDAVMRGDALGPLHGVPVSVKDLICTKDLPTVCGSKACADFVAEEDDICVARIRAAGAILLGKTNVPEFGYAGIGENALFPATANPWNPAMTSGGSSAGSAAAVASGMGSLSIGSDGGGSIRGPASFCGIVGVKPSFGRVPLWPGCRDPRYPGMSSWETIEHLGPLARTVRDAALLLSVIAGPDARDRHSIPAGDIDWPAAPGTPLPRPLRIAFTPDFGFSKVDAEVRALTATAARALAEATGAQLVEDSPAFTDMGPLFLSLVMRDSDLTGMRALAARDAISMPQLRGLLDRSWTAEDFTDAAMQRQAVCNSLARFMADYNVLLTPTVSTPAFPLGQFRPDRIEGVSSDTANGSPFTYPFNWSGQPAASVPVGWTAAGLPVGLQIIGRHLDDAMVLRMAAALETVLPWADQWPSITRQTADAA